MKNLLNWLIRKLIILISISEKRRRSPSPEENRDKKSGKYQSSLQNSILY